MTITTKWRAKIWFSNIWAWFTKKQNSAWMEYFNPSADFRGWGDEKYLQLIRLRLHRAEQDKICCSQLLDSSPIIYLKFVSTKRFGFLDVLTTSENKLVMFKRINMSLICSSWDQIRHFKSNYTKLEKLSPLLWNMGQLM